MIGPNPWALTTIKYCQIRRRGSVDSSRQAPTIRAAVGGQSVSRIGGKECECDASEGGKPVWRVEAGKESGTREDAE